MTLTFSRWPPGFQFPALSDDQSHLFAGSMTHYPAVCPGCSNLTPLLTYIPFCCSHTDLPVRVARLAPKATFVCTEMPLRRINAAAGMDVATFKKRLAQCKVGSEYLGPDTYGGAQVTSAEAFMNICLLRDENLSDAQRRALNELTSVEMGFSIDQTYYGSTDSPDSNKYHGAVLELQMEANRIAKCLQRAKRAAKDEAAGLNHLIEERKRELKAEIKFKEKDLEQLKEQVKDQPSKRSRVMQGTTASGAPYYKASVTK